MADSSIEWTEKTWNPTTGCDRISPGCDNCYALTMARRLKAMGSAKYQTDGHPVTSGPGFGLAVHPDALGEPLRWRKPATVFVNSMSDLFHARVPAEFIAQVWDVMARTPQHTYQILTKRPERLRRILNDRGFREQVAEGAGNLSPIGGIVQWPLRGVWLGTSVESAKYMHRIDDLRGTPAAIRFVSAEPLLGPLDGIDLTGIDWLIVGGESGRGARPMDLGWVRHLRDRCAESGTALFVKQLGLRWAQDTIWGGEPVAASDPKGGKRPECWPADLRIRQYPTTAGAVAA